MRKRRQLEDAGRPLDEGTIRTIIDSTYPLFRSRQAHERAATGDIQGKIVLKVN